MALPLPLRPILGRNQVSELKTSGVLYASNLAPFVEFIRILHRLRGELTMGFRNIIRLQIKLQLSLRTSKIVPVGFLEREARLVESLVDILEPQRSAP